jgi:hypothetical protein
MSTHAEYILWVGVLTENLPEEIPAEGIGGFLLILQRAHMGVERQGRKFEAISMHGENIGYGIIIATLGWITLDETPENPSLTDWATRGQSLQKTVEKYFRDNGLPLDVPVEVYHHMDLRE